jgi:hypothetical protein
MIAPNEDAWARIKPEIGRAIAELQRVVDSTLSESAFLALLEKRYRDGEALYKREWLDWSDPSKFDHELVQEIADGVLYIAMRRVRHPDEVGLA